MPNSSICLDASLVLGLVNHPSRERLKALWEEWRQEKLRFVAPDLLFYEITNAIYQYGKQGTLTPATAQRFLQLAQRLPIELRSDEDLHREAIHLAHQLSLPAAYDAHYLALARRLGVELWTVDRRLYGQVHEKLDWVRFFS